MNPHTIRGCAALTLVALGSAAITTAEEATATVSGGGTAMAPAEGVPAIELEKLVAPIALYPDVLIAQILPAATFPTDIVMAARWLRSKPDMKELTGKPWDVSILALCNYPELIFKLDEDFEWTNALGAAFLNQPDDVMAAIQTARKLAQERELLKSTPQQTVIVEQETVRIVPAETNTVYVPEYNPQIVYIDDDDDDDGDAWVGAAVGFGTGLALGAWLNMDCDWHGGVVHYCQPGYWGGWAHRGAVAWGDDWVAGVGPRGGFIAGEDRGVVVGPNRGAAWGPNGGAAWRRPAAAAPLPAYTGRYAGYNRYGGQNYGGRNFSGNTVNRNVNNVNVSGGNRVTVGGDRTAIGQGNRANIDRGDRTAIGGGDRTNVGTGDRANVGRGDRPAQPSARPGQGQGTGRPSNRPSQLPANAGESAIRQRPAVPSDRAPAGRDIGGGQRSSAFNGSQRPSQTSGYSQRGQQSRDVARPSQSGGSRRPASPSTPRAQPSRSSPPRQSAYSSGGGRRSSSYGSRGSASRGGGGGRGGGRRR